jgi:hypothetical protein
MADFPPLPLEPFHDPVLSGPDLLARLAWLRDVIAPRIDRFLGYYRNCTSELSSALPCSTNASFTVRPFRQFQELGLPARITGFRRSCDGGAVPTGTMEVQRKEVVIENDIAWRINTLVDFAAGRMPAIASTAPDPAQRRRLTRIINGFLQLGEESSSGGGIAFLQQLVLHGSIAGSAWVRLDPSPELLARLQDPPAGGAGAEAATEAFDPARWLTCEAVDAARVCPVFAPSSAQARRPGFVALLTQTVTLPSPSLVSSGLLDRVRSWFVRAPLAPSAEQFSFDLFGPEHWQRYAEGRLVAEGPNPLRLLPFVRFENAPDPAAGSRVGPAGGGLLDVGLGDVEPLIGLQDELNTRLSDRASRVTMTCFRMYLGRGIEDFTSRPVGPGQMWATDNPDAAIDSFGGDASMPSEDAHINEVREGLDKISGVSPVAAGLLRGKLGNLTSAIALRLTLIALLARTERKRAALTCTLAGVVSMALEILDRAGLVPSSPQDRGIDVNWPTPLPESDIDRLQEAQLKVALGVPRGMVLAELGYGELSEGAPAPVSATPVSAAPPAPPPIPQALPAPDSAEP